MIDHASADPSYVLFALGEATHALPTDAIQQLDMVGAVTPVPNALPYVAGVVSIRGQVVPAIDLRVRFGLPRTDLTPRSRLLVVRARGRTVAFIVDSAREFARIPSQAVQAPPEAMAGGSARYLRGVAQLGDRLVLVLAAEELLSEADDPRLAEMTARSA